MMISIDEAKAKVLNRFNRYHGASVGKGVKIDGTDYHKIIILTREDEVPGAAAVFRVVFAEYENVEVVASTTPVASASSENQEVVDDACFHCNCGH